MSNEGKQIENKVKVDLIWKGGVFILSAVCLIILNKFADSFVQQGEVLAQQSNLVAVQGQQIGAIFSSVSEIKNELKTQGGIDDQRDARIVKNSTNIEVIFDRQTEMRNRIDRIQYNKIPQLEGKQNGSSN